MMTRVAAAALVEDLDLHPRAGVDPVYVDELAEAIAAGVELPPIVVDQDSNRIVDGFHRRRAVIRAAGEDAEVDVIFTRYASEAELYLDALRLNARHGKAISGFHRTMAIQKAVALKIDPELVARTLGVRKDRIERIMKDRPRRIRKDGLRAKAMPLDGDPCRYVHRLTLAIEKGALDLTDEDLVTRLVDLEYALDELLSKPRGGARRGSAMQATAMLGEARN